MPLLTELMAFENRFYKDTAPTVLADNVSDLK
jgi:hypothetical protein